MGLRMRHRVAVLFVASLGLSLVYTSAALAATQWVNDDPPVGTNTSCANPGFNDIQSAVNAAGVGDTVRVCPGVYPGRIDVAKRLILRGAKFGVDARTRGTAGESIVAGGGGPAGYGFNLVADRIQLDGFTIRAVNSGPGVQTSPLFSGYLIANNIIQNNVFGINLHSAATFQTTVRTNLIRNNNVAGSANGNGIYGDQGTDRTFITRNAIRNQQNSGILLTGTGVVENNNVTIQFNQSLNNATFVALFHRNQNVQIRGNTTNDTVPGNNGSQGSAIFISDAANGVLVANNRINRSPFSGVAVREQSTLVGGFPMNVDVNANTITRAGASGISVTDTAPGALSVFRNVIRNSAEDGIFFGAGTSQNLINTNDARFSGDFDCHDESGPTGGGTSGTDNTWTNNIGPVDDPPGICRRP